MVFKSAGRLYKCIATGTGSLDYWGRSTGDAPWEREASDRARTAECASYVAPVARGECALSRRIAGWLGVRPGRLLRPIADRTGDDGMAKDRPRDWRYHGLQYGALHAGW